MIGIWVTYTIAAILILITPTHVSAQIINEICPTSCSGYSFEWVEIYNPTQNLITVSELVISDEKDQKLTFQSGEIAPGGYILATSSSVLNNSGDTVFIKDSGGLVLSSQSYSNLISNQNSYVRCEGEQWQVSHNPSPLSSNTASCLTSPTTSTISTDYDSIYLSEAMVDPALGEDEWVEVFNNNPFEVKLEDWSIDDGQNEGASPFKFTHILSAGSYGSVRITKTMFNNDGDTIRLINHLDSTKDTMVYTRSIKEKTIGRLSPQSSHVCAMSPTQDSKNLTCLVENTQPNTPASTLSITRTTTPQLSTLSLIPSDHESSSEQDIASDSQHFLLPILGTVKGVITKESTILNKPNKRSNQVYKTASSFAATSFMFSWANICYILFKLRRKYKQYYEEVIR